MIPWTFQNWIYYLGKKKNIRFSSTFWKNRCGRQVFYFIFYFLKNRLGRQVFFYFLFPQKQTRHVFTWAVIRQCSMGGILQPLMIFGPIKEPCWTLNQGIFLKKGASQLHGGRRIVLSRHDTKEYLKNASRLRQSPRRHYKERCDACYMYTCTKPHKKSKPSAYSIFRR